jgi:branched-chain amino acid transport system permease protein
VCDAIDDCRHCLVEWHGWPGQRFRGVLLGLIESLGAGYIGDLTGGFLGSQYQDIFAFIVLILVLTLRPQGLLGERVADRS